MTNKRFQPGDWVAYFSFVYSLYHWSYAIKYRIIKPTGPTHTSYFAVQWQPGRNGYGKITRIKNTDLLCNQAEYEQRCLNYEHEQLIQTLKKEHRDNSYF